MEYSGRGIFSDGILAKKSFGNFLNIPADAKNGFLDGDLAQEFFRKEMLAK